MFTSTRSPENSLAVLVYRGAGWISSWAFAGQSVSLTHLQAWRTGPHEHTRCTRLAREPTRGTLSPALAPGPDCWTHSTQLTGQLTRRRYIAGFRTFFERFLAILCFVLQGFRQTKRKTEGPQHFAFPEISRENRGCLVLHSGNSRVSMSTPVLRKKSPHFA